MATSIVTYTGELRTSCEHVRSGDIFITDAPIDNNGLGEAFSPTDTVATGFASCIITMMGMKARDLGVNLNNSKAEVTKHMSPDPRRITKIDVILSLPAIATEKERKILINTANTCPVHYSLHPDIDKNVIFNWVL